MMMMMIIISLPLGVRCGCGCSRRGSSRRIAMRIIMTIEGVVVSPRQVSSSSSIIIREAAERLQDEAAEARHALGHEVEGAEAAREVQAADEGVQRVVG